MRRKKSFVSEWLLPPAFSRIHRRLKILLHGRRETISRYRRSSDRFYVLANGPSLAVDLVRYRKEIAESDRVVVNYMGSSDAYEEIRPTVYLFADPMFFIPFCKMSDDWRDKTRRLADDIIRKTKWKLDLVVPWSGRNAEMVRALRQNANIAVYWYDNTCGVEPEDVDFGAWRDARRSPPAQTVTATAVYLGIFWRYREVWLLGADMSMHTNIGVEQDTNRLYIQNTHFDGVGPRIYAYRNAERTVPATVGWWLKSMARMFIDFESLGRFAAYAGVRVVNGSAFSWVDAFDRAPQEGE